MPYVTIEPWEMILDVIGLCLCGVTSLYLIKNRVKAGNDTEGRASNKSCRMFTEEVKIQLMRQQCEKAFDGIAEAVTKERQAVKKMITGGAIQKGQNPLPLKERDQCREDSRAKGKKIQHCDDTTTAQYAEIARLADMGLGMKAISEEVKIPKGEIQLILNLRREGCGFKDLNPEFRA